jgi:transcription elongation factor
LPAVALNPVLATAIATCTSDTFASIGLPRGDFLSINATVSDTTVPDLTPNVWGGELAGATASTCAITIVYTHPGWNDTITTYAWLPSSDWNGRLMGIGGGAWAAGNTVHAALPVVKGYAAVTTDGGHESIDDQSTISWAIIEGNINFYAFQDYAAVALDEAATLGKAFALAYYGREPDYSYWNVSEL